MINVLEAFSGIGAQAEALKQASIEFNVVHTVDWEIGAIYAYDILHNGPQDLRPYRFYTKNSLIEILSEYNLSTDGKNLMTASSFARKNLLQLKSILCAIERTNNLIDIQKVKATDIEEDIDLFTYSFPCQDLSAMSRIWHNEKGIDRDSGGKSSLLWEVERILFEYDETEKNLPKYLLMENVSEILSKKNIDNFETWCSSLNKLGYYNKVYTLKAEKFGIPQKRERTYMISILTEADPTIEAELDLYFMENDLEEVELPLEPLENFLKLDYSNPIYLEEAKKATPNYTPSRKKIHENNIILANDGTVNPGQVSRTITTKQDRNPNSGIITFSEDNEIINNRPYRNLTPRETFLLMGFSEEQYNDLLANDTEENQEINLLTDAKLHKLIGNSIVVQVLATIFTQMNEIDEKIMVKKRVEIYS